MMNKRKWWLRMGCPAKVMVKQWAVLWNIWLMMVGHHSYIMCAVFFVTEPWFSTLWCFAEPLSMRDLRNAEIYLMWWCLCRSRPALSRNWWEGIAWFFGFPHSNTVHFSTMEICILHLPAPLVVDLLAISAGCVWWLILFINFTWLFKHLVKSETTNEKTHCALFWVNNAD